VPPLTELHVERPLATSGPKIAIVGICPTTLQQRLRDMARSNEAIFEPGAGLSRIVTIRQP